MVNYSEQIHTIQQLAKMETQNADFYNKLAQKITNEDWKSMILSFARDDKYHAMWLKDAYYTLTGRMAEINTEYHDVGEYFESLDVRLLTEIRDGEKYRDYYLDAKIDSLRDIFFKIMYNKMQHAIKILYLMTLSRKV